MGEEESTASLSDPHVSLTVTNCRKGHVTHENIDIRENWRV